VIIDTAPTGHTLRMLNTPQFLDDLIEKVIKLSDKFAPVVKMFGGGGATGITDDSIAESKAKLQSFQLKMFELEELFADEEKSEFVIVTIPTSLAVSETKRLVGELEVSERSERAFLKTRMLAMKCAKLLQTDTSTTKLSHPIRLARITHFARPSSLTGENSVRENHGEPNSE
jgi:anion-transporting  ArsA/GET3 family ATPase